MLFYVEQMQYEIGSRDGELVRRKIGKEKVESYRYEDLIDDVDIWIFGKILELNALRDDCRNDIERAVHESEYQKLKEDERRVGKLYEKTCYGKAVDVLAERLAEKLFDNILKGKYKQEIQDMAEKICSFAEEEKRYGREMGAENRTINGDGSEAFGAKSCRERITGKSVHSFPDTAKTVRLSGGTESVKRAD